MKTNIKTTATLIITLAIFLIITGISFASGKDRDTTKSIQGYPIKFVKNLSNGIKSDNFGLRKSAVYLAGFYEIPEMEEPLIEQLSIEKSEVIKNLIALSLYRIGSENGLKAIMDILAMDHKILPDNKFRINLIKEISPVISD